MTDPQSFFAGVQALCALGHFLISYRAHRQRKQAAAARIGEQRIKVARRVVGLEREGRVAA